MRQVMHRLIRRPSPRKCQRPLPLDVAACHEDVGHRQKLAVRWRSQLVQFVPRENEHRQVCGGELATNAASARACANGSPPVKVTPSIPPTARISCARSSTVLSCRRANDHVSGFQQPGQCKGHP